MVTLGLKTDYFETRAHVINESLVKRRHNIAHGRELDVAPSDFDDLRKHVLDMMEHFAVQVYLAAAHGEYLAQTRGSPSIDGNP